MNPVDSKEKNCSTLSPSRSDDAFSRIDDSDDAIFYARERFVYHLDSLALDTVENLIRFLVVEKDPVILDLMAGWDSHIPASVKPSRVVGLGLNETELSENKILTERVIHDLNKNPVLPFENDTFDIVINTVSVDYMTRPVEVFRDVSRILKPGGLFLVIFSNRMFPQKVVKVWSEASDEERMLLVEEFFSTAEGFEKPRTFVSRNKPRPADDKYAEMGIPSDPVMAVYAERPAEENDRKDRPMISMDLVSGPDRETLEERKAAIKHTLECPYCGEELKKWAVPDNPFCQTWPNEFMYICFNDSCSYYVDGWDTLASQGVSHASYRLMYDPDRDCCLPVPVPTPYALKESIVA